MTGVKFLLRNLAITQKYFLNYEKHIKQKLMSNVCFNDLFIFAFQCVVSEYVYVCLILCVRARALRICLLTWDVGFCIDRALLVLSMSLKYWQCVAPNSWCNIFLRLILQRSDNLFCYFNCYLLTICLWFLPIRYLL